MNTNESLPESSWNSTCTTYSDEKTISESTLNYTFEMTDLNDYCRIHLMCIATNPYGRSEQYFTLSLNTSKSCSVVSPGPSITWEDYTNSIITTTLAIDASPTDFANNISTVDNANDILEIPIIGALVGAIICLALVLATLIIVVCFHKHKNK